MDPESNPVAFSENYPLNPEGIPLNIESVRDMITELNAISDGEYTDVGHAKEKIKEAEIMRGDLEYIKTAGPEIADELKGLIHAIEDLKGAIKQVHLNPYETQ
jgi:hypothetical protein